MVEASAWRAECAPALLFVPDGLVGNGGLADEALCHVLELRGVLAPQGRWRMVLAIVKDLEQSFKNHYDVLGT